MQSLSTFASKQIPFSQIIEEDLIGQPLPNEVLFDLQDRITFDNLYNEGYLLEDLDHSLVLLALKKISYDPIWYKLQEYTKIPPNDPSIDPASEESLAMIEEVYGYDTEDFIKILDKALGEILSFIIDLLSKPGELFIIEGDNGTHFFTWSHAGATYMLYERDVNSEENDFNVTSYQTLDNFLASMIGEFGSGWDKLTPEDHNTYQNSVLNILKKIPFDQEAVESIIGHLSVERKTIGIREPLDLCLADFTNEASIRIIGGYLYLILPSDIRWFSKEYLPFVLNTLTYNEGKWSYY